MKPGEILTINGEPYEVGGELDFSYAHGESTDHWRFHGLTRQVDGRRFFLHQRGDQRYPELYEEVGGVQASEWVSPEHGQNAKLSDQAFGTFTEGKVAFWWNVPREGHVLAAGGAPLETATKLITVRSEESGPMRWLLGRDLLERQDGAYITDDTPAETLPREDLERLPSTSHVWRYVCYALVLGLAGLVALDTRAKVHPTLDFVKVFWYVGLASLVATMIPRRHPLRLAHYIVTAGFLLYFQTLFIESLLGMSGSAPAANVEAFRVAGVLVALVALDLVWPKGFGMLAHAAMYSGLISLFLYSVGFLFYACSGGGAWTSYRQHVGGLPQGYIWILIFVAFLFRQIKDYRLVPVTLEGMLRLHRSLEKGLAADLQTVLGRAAVLGVMADDLHDSLLIANDPRLRSLAALSKGYLELSKLLKSLGKQRPPRVPDAQLAFRDLATLRADLRLIRENIERGDASESLPSLRLSPHLLAAGRGT